MKILLNSAKVSNEPVYTMTLVSNNDEEKKYVQSLCDEFNATAQGIIVLPYTTLIKDTGSMILQFRPLNYTRVPESAVYIPKEWRK